MICWVILLLRPVLTGLKSRRNLLLENLALRHQLLVLGRSSNRPRLTPDDRTLCGWLSQVWHGWKTRHCLVQPSTVTLNNAKSHCRSFIFNHRLPPNCEIRN